MALGIRVRVWRRRAERALQPQGTVQTGDRQGVRRGPGIESADGITFTNGKKTSAIVTLERDSDGHQT